MAVSGLRRVRVGEGEKILVTFRNLFSTRWLLADLLAVTGGNGPHLRCAPGIGVSVKTAATNVVEPLNPSVVNLSAIGEHIYANIFARVRS